MQTESKTRILIVEDHSVVRWAVRAYLEQQGIEVIGETGCIDEAVEMTASLKPDVVLMDLLLGNESGIDATKQLAAMCSNRIVAFSEYDSSECVKAFIGAGGRGFVSKLSPPSDLVEGINAVAQGGTWIPQEADGEMASNGNAAPKKRRGLSPKEREVVGYIALGLSNRQIAEKLFVSEKTVDTHRFRVYRKLGIHSRSELIDYAFREGLTAAIPHRGQTNVLPHPH